MRLIEGMIAFVIIIIIVILSLSVTYHKLETLQEQNAALRCEVADLKQACRWADILRQLLPSMAQDELDVLEEVYRQNKKR